MQGFIQTFVSGGSIKLSAGRHESRREAPSGGEVWGGGFHLPSMEVRGCYPGKILKLEAQFGAIWCILETK